MSNSANKALISVASFCAFYNDDQFFKEKGCVVNKWQNEAWYEAHLSSTNPPVFAPIIQDEMVAPSEVDGEIYHWRGHFGTGKKLTIIEVFQEWVSTSHELTVILTIEREQIDAFEAWVDEHPEVAIRYCYEKTAG
jgi:hypothetical protein